MSKRYEGISCNVMWREISYYAALSAHAVGLREKTMRSTLWKWSRTGFGNTPQRRMLTWAWESPRSTRSTHDAARNGCSGVSRGPKAMPDSSSECSMGLE